MDTDMNVGEVLRDVASGKVSPEEAERRLKGDPASQPRRVRVLPKFLRVDVDSVKGDKVDVRVPLRLVTAGMKIAAVIPDDTSSKLREKGIDLTQLGELQGDDLIDALRYPDERFLCRRYIPRMNGIEEFARFRFDRRFPGAIPDSVSFVLLIAFFGRRQIRHNRFSRKSCSVAQPRPAYPAGGRLSSLSRTSR